VQPSKMIKYLEKHKTISIIFTILIGIQIFFFSSIPGSQTSTGGINLIPIVYHFIIFFLFAFLLTITIKGTKKLKPKIIILAAFFSFIYAILDEFHQSFVPLRTPTVFDIFIDSFGIIVAIILIFLIERRTK